MEHKEHLEALHKQTLDKADEYLQSKQEVKDEHKEKISSAKKEWQESWNKFLETLVYLEQYEI